ncbi:guaA [Symbiodinium sp. CCMP2592]|nr:guaA [Symbiodinium sp. CCMP2592]
MDEGGLADVGAMPPEEEGAGFLPFLLLIVLVGAGWWFWSNSSAQTSAGTATAAPKPNPEELRRKRLEALEASMTSQQPAATTPAAAEAPSSATTATAKTPEAAAPAPPAAEKPAVEKPAAEKPKPKMEEEGLRKRVVPEVQKAPVPAPAPAKEAPVSAKENTPPPAAPERFALRARATLQGASVLRNLEGIEASTTVQRLRDMVQKAYLPDAKGQNLRIFFNGKELKELGLSAKQLGLGENACLQVMFSSPSAAPADSPAAAVTPPAAEGLIVRLQGTVGGRTCSHMIEELTTASSVLDLEGLALGAFEPGPEMKPRLFFMGRELKEAETFLGHVGLKTKSTATVQVMFAAGEPRAVAKAPAAQKPPAAEASETAQVSHEIADLGALPLQVIVSQDVFEKRHAFGHWKDFVVAAGEQNNPGGEARLKAGFTLLFAAIATVTVGTVIGYVISSEVATPYTAWVVVFILFAYAGAVFGYCFLTYEDPAQRVVTNLLFGLVPWTVSCACYLLAMIFVDLRRWETKDL